MAHSVAAIESSLRRRFRVVETVVDVGGRELRILHPESAEELIDELDFDRDERLPYWAELWPSSKILARLVLAMPGDGRTLLELGCGSGLVTTSAAIASFDVVASDYYEDACRFARVNVRHNGARDARGLVLDWRHLPESLERFDVVVAADVLYERPYGELVARTIGATLAGAGRAYLADPGRVGREAFLAALEPNALQLIGQKRYAFTEGAITQMITVFEIGRTKSE